MSQRFQFVVAIRSHTAAIAAIHNANVLDRSGSAQPGFLLAHTNESEVLEQMGRGTQYFVAVNDQKQVLGFVAIAQPQISQDFLHQINWIDPTVQTQILSDRHWYIKTVATDLQSMGQGVGQFLYQSLTTQFPNAVFSAFIVTQPVFNQRSLLFHEKQGFRPVGVFRQARFLDLDNYESTLVVKVCP